MQADQILVQLNEQQREAVTSSGSNVMVVAGAGSGKTRVLVHRIAWLIAVEQIPPQNIFGLLVNAYYFFPCLLLLTAFQFNILNRIQLSILFTETLMHYQSNSRTNIFISFIYSFSQYLFAQFFYITLPFKKVTW